MADEFTFRNRVFGKVGDIVCINGLDGKYRILDKLYDYEKGDHCICPNCGGLGTPWAGWYSCDGAADCYCIAFIGTGEVFLPIGGKERP